MTNKDLEDWLENAIDDSFDLGWTSRDAATLIVSRMQSEGLVLIAREGMRERVAKAICRADPAVRMGDADGVVEQRVSVEWPDYVSAADAAIAAILGEQP